jgi:hypothetical protein
MKTLLLIPATLMVLIPRFSDAVPADGGVTREIRRDTIEKLSEMLDDYVFPETGKMVRTRLTKNLASGTYDRIADFDEFAKAINEDMFSVSNDKHLIIRYAPDEISDMKKRNELSAMEKIEDRARGKEVSAEDNHGFVETRILPGNIGYIRMDEFERIAYSGETAAAAMTFLSNSDVLIVDLRLNNGGWSGGTQTMLSYFFDYDDLTNNILLFEHWTTCTGEKVQYRLLPDVSGKRIIEQPVYILTSHRTFSDGETFTDVLQKRGRATVIGETTGGGANGTRGPEILTDYFIVKMPVLRVINPVTGTNWEDTGVEPNIEIVSDKALDKAVELALSGIVERHPSEIYLNRAGYDYIHDGMIDAAIRIFKGMVDKYPSSANAYDSLAEAYMIKGERNLAIRNYRRSLELDPNNDNAVKMIEKMQRSCQ